MNFVGGVRQGTRTKWLDFRGDPDHDHKIFQSKYTADCIVGFIRQVAA